MEGQLHISNTALDNVHVQCSYRSGYGWDVLLGARRNGQTWSDAERRSYEYLTTEELVGVLFDELSRIFDGA